MVKCAMFLSYDLLLHTKLDIYETASNEDLREQ